MPSVELRWVLHLVGFGTVLFGLAACGSSASVEKLRKENKQLRQRLEQAREEAASPQRGETVTVLSADVYFKSGSADLTQRGVEELKLVAQRIQQEFPERTVRIEGYTDSRPIGERLEDKYPSNWELSAARAALKDAPLPPDLTLAAVGRDTPREVLVAIAELCCECGVMPVPGSVMRGVALDGICLFATDPSGGIAATASCLRMHHPASRWARVAMWGRSLR